MEDGGSSFVKVNYPLLIFVILQIIFIVLCAVSLPKIFVSNRADEGNFANLPRITIDGSSEILPKEVDVMEWILLDAVKENVSEVAFGEADAVIRDESVKKQYFELPNIYYYSAIVDIPDLNQSYWVFYEYSDEENNINLSANNQYLAMCIVDPEEIVYRDFDCKSQYGQLTYNAIAKKYLGWSNFDNIIVEVSDDYGEIQIIIINDEDNSNNEKYINEVKEKIRSLGIYPEIFEYNVIPSSEIPGFHYVAI